MNKMNIMVTTIRELRVIVSSISNIPHWLIDTFINAQEATPAMEPEKALTFEELISIL